MRKSREETARTRECIIDAACEEIRARCRKWTGHAQSHDHQPHLASFRLAAASRRELQASPDPLLVPKVRDIVGLYIHPPEHAVLLCVDEKSQIQALDRTAPLLPLRLLAALDAQSGKVLVQTHRGHRSIEFRKFLERIDASVPPDQEVHMVTDNYGSHKTPLIRAWFAKRPRFRLHFTPTYGSWLNQVERWFEELTTKQIRRGAHRSVSELERFIYEFLDAHNADAKPFVWAKSADEILASIARFAHQAAQLMSRTLVQDARL